jgi:hypothetical protein
MEQRIDRIAPFALVAVFTVVVQGLSLMEFLPLPTALLIGAGWAVLIGFAARWASLRPALTAWAEDGLVALGCVNHGTVRVRRRHRADDAGHCAG